MKTLFNDGWKFAELALNYKEMFKDEKPVLFNPEDYFANAKTLNFADVRVPHDWMISNTKDLYRNSVGFYYKEFELSEAKVQNKHKFFYNCALHIAVSGGWIMHLHNCVDNDIPQQFSPRKQRDIKHHTYDQFRPLCPAHNKHCKSNVGI